MLLTLSWGIFIHIWQSEGQPCSSGYKHNVPEVSMRFRSREDGGQPVASVPLFLQKLPSWSCTRRRPVWQWSKVTWYLMAVSVQWKAEWQLPALGFYGKSQLGLFLVLWSETPVACGWSFCRALPGLTLFLHEQRSSSGSCWWTKDLLRPYPAFLVTAVDGYPGEVGPPVKPLRGPGIPSHYQ